MRVLLEDVFPLGDFFGQIINQINDFAHLLNHPLIIFQIKRFSYGDSDLQSGVDFSKSNSVFFKGLVINSDTERNTNFISSGISLTDTLTSGVDLVGNTEFLKAINYKAN